LEEAARQARRREVLESLARDPGVVDEVSRYCETRFGAVQPPPPVFPLPEELHVADWRDYAAQGGARAFEHLRGRLAQLQVPVREGVSKLPAYADVVLRGLPFEAEAFGGALELARPDAIQLLIHEHPAGALPVLVAPERSDFEALVRALAFRGEPRPISPSVNAQMVSGLVNWDRMRRYRAAWTAQVDPSLADSLWPVEMSRVATSERWRYQDRLIIIGVCPYSGVSAAQLGLEMSETEWLERSTTLRVEHEFTHYATQRVYGAMSLNLLDETISDFMGMTHALGRFRASWYLSFLGLEAWPQIRESGRIGTYSGDLSPAGLELLAALAVKAAARLEEIAERFYDPRGRGAFLLALASLTLELLAAEDAVALFAEAHDASRRLT
jgi:hypothetical protein